MYSLNIKIVSQLNCVLLISSSCHGDGERTLLSKRASTQISDGCAEKNSIRILSSKLIIKFN